METLQTGHLSSCSHFLDGRAQAPAVNIRRHTAQGTETGAGRCSCWIRLRSMRIPRRLKGGFSGGSVNRQFHLVSRLRITGVIPTSTLPNV
jgi:hypothetical protein